MQNSSLETWKWITGPEAAELLSAASDVEAGDVQSISRLRKRWNADLVGTALELLSARRRAMMKFPLHPPTACDQPGVEQATPECIADYKARRIHDALSGPAHVLDLACGIGGDAMALARSHHATAVDLDPIRCWMAETNAGCSTVQGDATRIEIEADAFHLDPGRRDERTGRRLRSPASWQPPLSCVEAMADRFQGGVVKLGPGIPFEDVPDIEGSELEFVSLGGRLSQSHLWLGTLATAPGHHRATMLPLGLTESGPPDYSDLRHDAAFDSVLCVPDPALERSGLHGSVSRRFGLQEPVAGLGLFTGDAPPSSPWFTSFHVEATMPWRVDRVTHWLRQHDTGHVEIKTRDRAADPDLLQSRLSGSGSIPRSVFVLRMGRPVVAVITRRVDNSTASIESSREPDADPASH